MVGVGFEFPEALLALAVLPPLLWYIRRVDMRARETARAFKSRVPAKWFFRARQGLVALLLTSLAVIGAKPYIQSPDTADYLFVVDVSRSMTARFSCGEPTFLDRSKTAMRAVLEAVPEGRFGIVAADRFAFPISQITYDHAYLDEVIENGLFVGLTYDATATDLGNALSVVAAKKKDAPEIFGNVRQVVMFSDGHIEGDYVRTLRQPLNDLAKAGIAVAAVAIGNAARTPIPEGEGDDCRSEYIKVAGEPVSIPMRPDIMEFVARETGGISASESEMEKVARYLRETGLKPAEGLSEHSTTRRDIGRVFLVPASLAFLGMLLLRANVGFLRWRNATPGEIR